MNTDRSDFAAADFEPVFEATFFRELAQRKVDSWKLDKEPKTIFASYKSYKPPLEQPMLNFSGYSFEEPSVSSGGPYEVWLKGKIYLFNTEEEYKNANLQEIYDNTRKESLVQIENMRMFVSLKFKDVERFGFTYFVLVMFADLKTYVFSHRFILTLPDPSSLQGCLEPDTIRTISELLADPGYQMSEVGVIAENAAMFDFRDNKINSVYKYGSHENMFGFFDGLEQQNKVNSLFLHYMELFSHFHKRDAYFVLFKDFLPIRSAKFAEPKLSMIVHAKLTQFKAVERKVTDLREYSFNLREAMDEKEVAAQAVDLNIKLMRWRQLDTLDLDLLHNVRILLLGAGTLGCQLARNLIGWGIRHYTFVDYGKVNHSNPVRQSLYKYEDVVKGRNKAEAAAEALQAIMPTIECRGVTMSIPMAGHGIRESQREKVMQEVDALDQLIQEHDAVFLLLDTREARWLPTVMAASHNKICLSVALGFDNFIVIRHGACPVDYEPKKYGKRPGCYFCNDYLHPSNTTRDRSLDQQCTVTRPGLSFLSTAYASELLVNLIHAKQEDIDRELSSGETLNTDFGIVPQHVRGSASGFNVDLMTSEAYDSCLACGSKIVQEYRKDKHALVEKALCDPKYLQMVSGIESDLAANEGDGAEIMCIDDNDIETTATLSESKDTSKTTQASERKD